MKKIYFVRHGESEANLAEIASGQGNDVPLTNNGRKQAKLAGRSLKDKNIELVVSSPLIRTRQTAEIIAEEIGYDPKKIVYNPLFAERSLGLYEGGPMSVYWKDLQDNTLHASAETTEQMYARFTQALESLHQYKENTILVVSHGGASRAVRVINQKLHHSKMYELEAFANAHIYEFEL